MRAASKQKWLEAHGIEHWTHFYTDYGRELQLNVLRPFPARRRTTAGIEAAEGAAAGPPSRREIRRARGERMAARAHAVDQVLSRPRRAARSPRAAAGTPTLRFAAMGDGLTFLTPPLDADTEITGPSAPSCSSRPRTSDADLFLGAARLHRATCKEVVFQGAIDPHTPSRARLAARLAPQARSRNCRCPTGPITRTTRSSRSARRKPVELDIEIWPTCIVVPAGYRIGLTDARQGLRVRRRQRRQAVQLQERAQGCGPFLHDDPRDRPPAVFDGITTLHFGRGKAAYLLLPIIPPKKPARKQPGGKKRRRK